MLPAHRSEQESVPNPLQLEPARALIGWMSQEEAVLWQAGRRHDRIDNPAYRQRAEQARLAVEARGSSFDQGQVIVHGPDDLPESLSAHLAALREQPASQQFLDAGWRVVIAELSKVCAIQPMIYGPSQAVAPAMFSDADPARLAQFCLPIRCPDEMPYRYNPATNAFSITSTNQNLQVINEFHSMIEPGVMAFGFLVDLTPSFMQVARHGDRYILRDGHHRAHQLIAAGITQVPVLYKHFELSEDIIMPAGSFSRLLYQGKQPATLSDYGNDQVSADLAMPAVNKTIIVQGLSVTTLKC